MNTEAFLDKNKFIRFLTEPEFHRWRHGGLLVCMALIAFNSGILSYLGSVEMSRGVVVFQSILLFCTFVGAVYFNTRYLVPRFLLRDNYLIYVLTVSGIILCMEAVNTMAEFVILHRFGIVPGLYSYFHPNRKIVLDLMTEFFGTAICLAGTTLPVLLRHRIQNANRKVELEKATIRQQTEALRHRVAPSFFFGMLDTAAVSVRIDPLKSSGILMGLSRFLRYRLYDSSREWVFLNSEIAFLDNYLRLESYRRPGFSYSLRSECGNVRIPVPPMLFFPLLVYVMDQIPENQIISALSIVFSAGKGRLSVTASVDPCHATSDTRAWEEIRNRLDWVYPDNYRLKKEDAPAGLLVTMEIPVRL